MGAALTYARRYALFTLVGIAGEDDIDAPNLTANSRIEPIQSADSKRGSADNAASNQATANSKRSGAASVVARKILDAKQSADMRDKLVDELENVSSPDDAAAWAHRRLASKNALTTADANAVERAFAERLAAFDQTTAANEQSDRTAGSEAASSSGYEIRPALLKVIRLRDKEHRKFVARQPCVICGRTPSDAHHLRFAQPRALGRRVSDEYTVPLCRMHHRELHRCGDEVAWWNSINIDPLPIALKLWRETHLDVQQI
jgi:hypothetical protein